MAGHCSYQAELYPRREVTEKELNHMKKLFPKKRTGPIYERGVLRVNDHVQIIVRSTSELLDQWTELVQWCTAQGMRLRANSYLECCEPRHVFYLDEDGCDWHEAEEGEYYLREGFTTEVLIQELVRRDVTEEEICAVIGRLRGEKHEN